MIDHVEALKALVRHAMTFGGGFLVAAGDLSVTDLETASGALASLAGLVWSIVAKRRAA